jgi:hypothetical protein
MIAVVRPNAALIRKVHELLGAGDFAQPLCIGRALPSRIRGGIPGATQAFVATDVNDLGSWASAAMPTPAAFTVRSCAATATCRPPARLICSAPPTGAPVRDGNY